MSAASSIGEDSPSSGGSMAAVATLAAFASGVDFDGLDTQVQDRLRWILTDTIAAIAAGSAEPEVRALVHRRGPGTGATIIGQGVECNPDLASLFNASAGTFLEMDEGNRFARGHPAIHVLPAGLAFCEVRELDASTLLTALLCGYEVCSRIGAASRLRNNLHPHGTWGTLGAAAACGRANGIDAAAMAELLGIASSLMTVTSKKTMLEGGLVRNVYAGLANRNGMFALQLLESGFSGECNGLGTMFGEILSPSFEPDVLVRGLGSEWHVMHNYFKLHSCCRYAHGVLDAIDQLGASGELPAPSQMADVDRILVETYSFAAELNDPQPRNTLAAKFSIPFAVAARLVMGSSGMASFTHEALRNQTALALAKKVVVREDPAMTARLPHERPARVTIVLLNGATACAAVGFNRGDDALPYTTDELEGKFFDLTQRIWPRAHCAALLDASLSLGRRGTSIAAWYKLLREPPRTQTRS